VLLQGADHLKLDIQLRRTAVPGHKLQYASGIIDNMSTVREQYVSFGKLEPVKLVITGPPCAGKTALAQYIAEAYSTPLLTLADIKACVSQLPAADAAGFKSAVSLSPAQLAQLCRAALADVAPRNRGFVLDGYPSTLCEARELFTDSRQWTAEETADADELSATAQADAEAAAAQKGAKGAKKLAKDTKPGSAQAQSAIDNVPEPRKLLEGLVPNVLVCSQHLRLIT
jgi:hypothetical protein